MSIIGYIFYGIAFISPPLSIILAFICKGIRGTFFENKVPMIFFLLQFVFVLILLVSFFTAENENYFYNNYWIIYLIALLSGISLHLQILHLLTKVNK